VGEWTQDKLKILELYLPRYLSATSKAIDRVYIDAFAGPGTNVLRTSRTTIPGSPLIAAAAVASNGARFTRLIFIEKDKALAEELASKLSSDPRCEVYQGDVNVVLPSVVTTINRRAPTFVLLDTEGIEPKWTTVQAIAPWKVELLVNFPLGMSIKRNPESQKTIDYFDTDACLPLLEQSTVEKDRALLDLYKAGLAKLGFGFTTTNDRLIRTQGNRKLYYLVFVSKEDIGRRIMNAVLKQPDSRGQGRLSL